MIVTTLGERIRAYRLARNWSQEELADVAGISRSEIGRLERDEVIYPMHETVAKLEKCFDMPPGTMFSVYQVNEDEEDVIRRITQMLIQSDMDVSQLRQFEALIGTVIDIVNEAVSPMSHRPYMYRPGKRTDKKSQPQQTSHSKVKPTTPTVWVLLVGCMAAAAGRID